MAQINKLEKEGETLSRSSGIVSFQFPVDFKNADRRFEKKYGDVIAPVKYKAMDGNFINSDQNAWFRFSTQNRKLVEKLNSENVIVNEYEYPAGSEVAAYRKLIKRSTVFLPHEEAEDHFFKAIDNLNKNNEYGRLKIEKEYYAHQGYSKFWTVLSDKRHSVEKGDIVQFGISLRNGIGTGTALGGDIYSFRLVCQNGAVAKDQTLGSFTILHRRTVDEILEDLVNGISKTLEAYSDILKYYKHWTNIKMTPKMLSTIVKRKFLPLSIYPEHAIEVVTKREDKTLKDPTVKLIDPNLNIWEFFNSITQVSTHEVNRKKGEKDSDGKRLNKINFEIFSWRTSKLQKTLMELAPLAIPHQ